MRNQRIDEAVDVVTPERRQRVHVGPGVQVLPAIDQRKKLRPRHRIDLVDHQQRRFPGRFHLIERLAGRGVDGRRPCLDEEESEIRVGERLQCPLDHAGIQATLGGVEARRVEKRDLGIRPRDDPENTAAGGLRLGADDGEFLADQPVEERALAHVGPADDGDEACPHLHATA